MCCTNQTLPVERCLSSAARVSSLLVLAHMLWVVCSACCACMSMPTVAEMTAILGVISPTHLAGLRCRCAGPLALCRRWVVLRQCLSRGDTVLVLGLPIDRPVVGGCNAEIDHPDMVSYCQVKHLALPWVCDTEAGNFTEKTRHSLVQPRV